MSTRCTLTTLIPIWHQNLLYWLNQIQTG